MKAVFTIEQVDGKLVITIEQAEPITKEQDGIDWSKPVAFPKDYNIPKGTRVIVVSEDRGEDFTDYRKVGLKGKTTESSTVPFCNWEDKRKMIPMCSDELAPINPTDHPLHPDFKGNK
jgi:hypothetical protein